MASAPKKLNLAEVTAIGIGGMIGGGIFAVLGLAIATAGHAVVFTLLAGGVVALLTGLSYARLGLAFRGDGGSFTYILQGFGPSVAGMAGWVLVAGYVGTLSLYASAFSTYGATLLGMADSTLLRDGLAALVIGGFLAVNLRGAKLSGGVELAVVLAKLAILALFAVAGLTTAHAGALVPAFDNGFVTPLVAAALIFVAYEGFELIPNAIDEMADPARNLPRAIIIAIVVTTFIYVLVAATALANLSLPQILHDQEYVLAVAARPALGQAGFALIGIAALLSTASAINATLFGASRLTMVMAEEGALPPLFARRTPGQAVPHAALMALSGLSLLLTLTAGLESISLFASVTFLLIFAGVNFAGLRLAGRIGLNRLTPLAGGVLATLSVGVLLWHDGRSDPKQLVILLVCYGAALAARLVWRPA
ncbi:MAG: amino acid permease [Alphaproteobacteria bacterium]|nr:amino acid permease [Alphaproteobacteria bacterium]